MRGSRPISFESLEHLISLRDKCGVFGQWTLYLFASITKMHQPKEEKCWASLCVVCLKQIAICRSVQKISLQIISYFINEENINYIMFSDPTEADLSLHEIYV